MGRKWGILFSRIVLRWRRNCFSISTNRGIEWAEWSGPWIITGRFGGKYAIFHFRCSYLEVDLDGMRSTNRLLEILGRDGWLRMHLPSTKPPIHYLVPLQTLMPLSKMGNGILNRNQSTREIRTLG